MRARPALLLAALLPHAAFAAAPGGGEDAWTPVGLSGGGAMFGPAISPADPRRMLVHCDMSGAYRSEDGGRTWRLIHADQLQGNTICRPAFHPSDAEVAYSPSGWSPRLKRTRDGGRTWEDLGDLGGTPQGLVAVDPGDPSRLLVGVANAVALSRDGGRTWARCSAVRGEAVGFFFHRDRLWAATREGIWRSDDGGVTWAETCAGLPGRELRGFSGGARGETVRLYCTVPCKVVEGRLAGGIFASSDGGDSWASAMGRGLNVETRAFDRWAMGDIVQYHQVLTTDVDPLRAYAFNANTGIPPPHHTAVYRTDDGGATWRPTFFPDPRWPGFNLEHNYTTTGVGQYFQAVPAGAAICASDPDRLMQLGDGDCIITADGGKSWFNGQTRIALPPPQATFRNTGLVVTSTWNHYVDPFIPSRHYICYTDIGFAISDDRGATWRWWGRGRRAPWQNTCYELAFDPEVKGLVWGAFANVHDIPNDNIISGRHRSQGPGGVCVSRDACESWEVAGKGLPEAPVVSVVLDPHSPAGRRTLYAGVFGHGVFKSTDGGRSWDDAGRGVGSAANRRVVRVQLHKDGTLFALVTALRSGRSYVPEGPGLYRSRDGGGTWALISGPQSLSWSKDFAVDPSDSRRIFVAAADAGESRGGLYGTRDGGATWTLVARKGPQHFSAAFSPHHPGWIYMTLCEGAPGPALWLSRDGGETWEPFRSLPFRNAQRVCFDPGDPGAIYLTTFGASVLKGPAEP
jgi:photosystem II stability/assembly factor-like uncharacterized protein